MLRCGRIFAIAYLRFRRKEIRDKSAISIEGVGYLGTVMTVKAGYDGIGKHVIRFGKMRWQSDLPSKTDYNQKSITEHVFSAFGSLSGCAELFLGVK